MEMGLKGHGLNGHRETASMKHLLSEKDSSGSGAHDLFFGEPKIVPRVGDEYQVEIPMLLSNSEYESYVKNPIEAEFNSNLVHFDSVVGKSNIPLMLIEESMIKHDDLVVEETDKKMVSKSLGNDYCLVPGECADTFTDAEEASFILGLYIFGKNLVQVKRLIENKTMGNVLSFYYGKFYKSDGYRRWLEGRKMSSRKFVHGHRIFAGLRQQEFLSRLTSKVPGEMKSALSQVSKAYGEGKMSMEDFILILKAMVGLKNLVEAVGIGKGKQDLTRAYLEPSRFNNSNAARSEVMVPVGKACSSLTHAEIVGFLTGDFRLSKARTNDLFWEAVWPRLLERGWHSEQPKDYNYASTTKNQLVFLLPGITKFNRRRLLKGQDFLDSIKDVLNKVALDPSLFELDNDKTNNVELQQQCCYLQPLTDNERERDDSMMKLTVVDTSMAHEQPFKVRELKALPIGISIISPRPNHSKETSSEETNSKPVKENQEGNFSSSNLNLKKGSNTTKRLNQENSDTVAKERKKLASGTSRSMKIDAKRIPENKSHEKAEPSQTVIDPKKDAIVSNTTEDMNTRRHSTRNRPPTRRALEAHANGYLKIGTKKMDKAATPRPKLTSSSTTPTPNREVSRTFLASNATDNTPQD
ncbi:uncharacterized protein LOC124924041 [Impatiens glandulifera]|uniref:uncharacterized protein LOC124924041 n=1 Tax=Impatiens glandulifera TaxID=253017 RepID=UPI001FB18E9F|nr:uncharacterized protein LOC124924041 [Impatiens glandulifera]